MIYNHSVFEPWPIENESVQSIITSPPYYALRKYDIPDVIIGGDNNCEHKFEIVTKRAGGGTNGNVGNNVDTRIHYEAQSGICLKCQTYKGQYGLEPTPQMYVEHTLLWAKEAWRVLRNDGILFLNIADSYSGSGCGTNDYRTEASKSINGIGKYVDLYKTGGITQKLKDYPKKCQLLIPHRVAISLVDSGWTLRNSIIWHKPNAMPESVTDRFSKKYEYIFMFTKQEKYYFDLDAIREPHKEVSIERVKHKFNPTKVVGRAINNEGDMARFCHPLGKNPGDVWTIPTCPSSEKHYAMWPERLVERMVKCSTKAGDIVLDPFCGSGSTLKVAEQLHRKGIGIDLGYHEMSKRRTSKIQKEMFT